jgi:Flp pilus assembly pilin Flp
MSWRPAAFMNEEDGNDLLEYAFLAGLLSLACFIALIAVGADIRSMFGVLAAEFDKIFS